MSALTQIADATRHHTATCTCGWRDRSATRPGAQMLGASHQQRSGLRGHRVLIGGGK